MIIPENTKHSLIALCDCNNFFVSCERLFHPELRDRPIVILSSNDCCVVSRSNESKKIGIPMGTPYFKIRRLCDEYRITICSGNMELYQDVSSRIQKVLLKFTPTVEQTSVDEAFLDMSIASVADAEEYCRKLRKEVLHQCGIPLSIGLAPTKTLSKFAAESAKHRPSGGCVQLLDYLELPVLWPRMSLKKIWGIGHEKLENLAQYGIYTASQLLSQGKNWIQKQLSIRGLMTCSELKGIPCFPLTGKQKISQSLEVTRSFGVSSSNFSDLTTALFHHTANAAGQLHAMGLVAGTVAVLIATSRYADPCYSNVFRVSLPAPSSTNSKLSEAVFYALRRIFVPGLQYNRAGILLTNLKREGNRQLEFADLPTMKKSNEISLQKTIEMLNNILGKNTIIPASLKMDSRTQVRCEKISLWKNNIFE